MGLPGILYSHMRLWVLPLCVGRGATAPLTGHWGTGERDPARSLDVRNNIWNIRRHYQTSSYKWATTWRNQRNDCAPSEDSDQPRTQISLGTCLVWSESTLCTQWVAKDLSSVHADSEDSADAQADLGLRWAYMPFCWFYHVLAQMFCFCWTAETQNSSSIMG